MLSSFSTSANFLIIVFVGECLSLMNSLAKEHQYLANLPCMCVYLFIHLTICLLLKCTAIYEL